MQIPVVQSCVAEGTINETNFAMSSFTVWEFCQNFVENHEG